MSLNWELSAIENWKELCFLPDDGGMKPKTYGLLMMSMCCGYSRITEKNYVDVFQRVQIYETTRGVFAQNSEGPMPVTLADVKAHIGLHVNATPRTVKQFNDNLMRVLWADAQHETRRQEQS